MATGLLYALFAAIATTANIGAQVAVDRSMSGSAGVYLGILVGTGVGLACKYVLDRRWIFRFQSASRVHEARTFVVYALFSGVTTLVFWGTELLFEALWGTAMMRYLGAVLGLAIGYTMKYLLDRRYTFVAHRKVTA